MRVNVTKSPDGTLYMTKDGHGELFADDVKVGAKPAKFGDNTVELFVVEPKYADDEPQTMVRFSYVDYLDTSNRDVPGKGVRQLFDCPVPCRRDFGPYVVEVTDA